VGVPKFFRESEPIGIVLTPGTLWLELLPLTQKYPKRKEWQFWERLFKIESIYFQFWRFIFSLKFENFDFLVSEIFNLLKFSTELPINDEV
jgi:hypothetical protein